MGEGYHNFHHQFPMDYRNAVRWYQFDPTKWFIATCAALGLASQLHTFPENEINKGELTMKLKKLKKFQDAIRWPVQLADLPVVSWESCEYRVILGPFGCRSPQCWERSSQRSEREAARDSFGVRT